MVLPAISLVSQEIRLDSDFLTYKLVISYDAKRLIYVSNKKIEYLIAAAKDLADQVALTKEEKAFPPMPSFERRIVHAELAQRTDIITESQGDGFDRHIVIKPK